MAKKEQQVSDQPADNAQGQQEDGELLHELREAYEQARIDLKQTTEKLRSELQKIDVEEAGEKAKTWVKENPGLAFFLAVGAGMLFGRTLTKALDPPPPPSLSERARQKSNFLANSARDFAGDAIDKLSVHASTAGEQMADRMRNVRGSLYERAENLGDDLRSRAGELGNSASHKSNELISSFSDAAERAADSLQVAARDLSKTVKLQRKKQQSLYESILHAAKTVFGAMVFKRLSDWIRERY